MIATMIRSLLLVPLFLHSVLAQGGDGGDDVCTLECQNGTPCVKGDLNTTGLPYDRVTGQVYLHTNTNRDGWKCDCPAGYTGIRCGRTFESCNAEESQGCYHGGECLEGVTDQYGNEQFFCDCSSAMEVTEEDFKVNVTQYVGRFCEQPVAPSDRCPDDTFFCLNGGTCRTEGDDIEINPCTCPLDYTGEHCEFRDKQVPDCELDCGLNGSCRLGKKALSPEELASGMTEHDNYRYCVCKAGYTGDQCSTVEEGTPTLSPSTFAPTSSWFPTITPEPSFTPYPTEEARDPERYVDDHKDLSKSSGGSGGDGGDGLTGGAKFGIVAAVFGGFVAFALVIFKRRRKAKSLDPTIPGSIMPPIPDPTTSEESEMDTVEIL